MSYEHNLFISQGTDFTANVVFYTSNTSGRYPVDTSNYTSGRCHMRKCVGSTSYTEFTVTFPADAATAGIVTIALRDDQTSIIEDGRYLYDVEATSSTGNIEQVVRGTITLHRSITR